MPSPLSLLAALAAVIGPVATLVGLIQSRGWLAGIGTALACIAVVAVGYARLQRQRLESASVEIEGISIDSLNAANLRRRVSRNFLIQTVHHTVTIEGADLRVVWRYAGFCRVQQATAFQFSVDSEQNVPITELECFAYDLQHDGGRLHRITPVLTGPDSISKKLAVPFARPVQSQQPFDVELHCHLPATFRAGKTYYISSLSFDQPTVGSCTVNLIFRDQFPEWVRVYECIPGRPPLLLRSLTPTRQDGASAEYIDAAEHRAAKSARVYLFQRPSFEIGLHRQ